jgi:hypothetical protein
MDEYNDMTDEEYDALDEELTRTVPKVGPDGSGWLSQMGFRPLNLSTVSVNYIMTKAMASHKSPAKIIDELVNEKIAASM